MSDQACIPHKTTWTRPSLHSHDLGYAHILYIHHGSSPVGVSDEHLHVGVALEDAHGVLGRYLAESAHRAELEGWLHGSQEHLTKCRKGYSYGRAFTCGEVQVCLFVPMDGWMDGNNEKNHHNHHNKGADKKRHTHTLQACFYIVRVLHVIEHRLNRYQTTPEAR